MSNVITGQNQVFTISNGGGALKGYFTVTSTAGANRNAPYGFDGAEWFRVRFRLIKPRRLGTETRDKIVQLCLGYSCPPFVIAGDSVEAPSNQPASARRTDWYRLGDQVELNEQGEALTRLKTLSEGWLLPGHSYGVIDIQPNKCGDVIHDQLLVVLTHEGLRVELSGFYFKPIRFPTP